MPPQKKVLSAARRLRSLAAMGQRQEIQHSAQQPGNFYLMIFRNFSYVIFLFPPTQGWGEGDLLKKIILIEATMDTLISYKLVRKGLQ